MFTAEVGAVLEIGDVDLTVMPEDELADRMLQLDQLQSMLAAEKMRVLAQAEKRRVGSHQRVRSTAKWMTSATRRREYAVASEIKTASDVVFGLPLVLAELTNAAINLDHVKAIRSLYRQTKFRDAVVRDQQLFLDWAYEDPFPIFESKLSMWAVLNDPTDPDDLDDADFDARGLTVVRGFGNTMLGELTTTTLAWEEFLTLVQPRYDRLWSADWAEARERLGDDACEADLVRTESQRWHDAMMEAIRASAGRDAGAPDFVVNLVCDADTFEAEVRRRASTDDVAAPSAASSLANWDLMRCETATGLPVSPPTMVMAALAGRVRTVLLSAGPLHFSMSETTRLFRGNQRLGILIRDRHCRGPGCSTNASACDVDHIRPHARGGPTLPGNGAALCKGCHRHKTRLEALGVPV